MAETAVSLYSNPILRGNPTIINDTGTSPSNTQDRIAVVASTSTASAQNLPVGSYIFTYTNKSTVSNSVNKTLPVYYDVYTYSYITNPLTTTNFLLLSGTWKSSGIGLLENNINPVLMRRIA